MFHEGQRVHVNQDNEDWGRIAHDGTVRSVETDYLLVEIDGIRATVAVEFTEARSVGREMHKVWVDGKTMVHGPGHLSETKSAEWVETYRKINPDLPADAIYVENTYFDK